MTLRLVDGDENCNVHFGAGHGGRRSGSKGPQCCRGWAAPTRAESEEGFGSGALHDTFGEPRAGRRPPHRVQGGTISLRGRVGEMDATPQLVEIDAHSVKLVAAVRP